MNLEDQLFFQKYLDEQVLEIGYLAGNLKCSCGNDEFYVFHNGKRTRGILTSLIWKSKSLTLITVCSRCGKEIRIMGDKKLDTLKEFMLNKEKTRLKLSIKIDFWPEKFIVGRHYTNDYEFISIDANSPSKKKSVYLLGYRAAKERFRTILYEKYTK